MQKPAKRMIRKAAQVQRAAAGNSYLPQNRACDQCPLVSAATDTRKEA